MVDGKCASPQNPAVPHSETHQERQEKKQQLEQMSVSQQSSWYDSNKPNVDTIQGAGDGWSKRSEVSVMSVLQQKGDRMTDMSVSFHLRTYWKTMNSQVL